MGKGVHDVYKYNFSAVLARWMETAWFFRTDSRTMEFWNESRFSSISLMTAELVKVDRVRLFYATLGTYFGRIR